MSILKKIKDVIGMQGVNIELLTADRISRHAKHIKGKVILTAESNQKIYNVNVRFVKEIQLDKAGEKTKEKILGKQVFDVNSIKKGEQKEFDFDFTIQLPLEDKDKSQSKNFFSKWLSLDTRESKIRYVVKAECDVVSAVLDPQEEKQVKIDD